jgi:CRP/FNR family transcriptional regulator
MTEPVDAIRLALHAGGQFVRFKAGDRLFAPGDRPGSWVAIERGCVRVSLLAPSGREMTLYRIGAGESCLLTTSSLIGDEPLPAEGYAETDVEARIVSKATFDRLVAEDQDFRRDVLRNYANRVADLVVTMQDVLFRAIPERLARTLLVRERQGIVEATHQEIANELGSAREVVSRVLQRFEREGVIAIERGRIVIRDSEALRRRAAPEQ